MVKEGEITELMAIYCKSVHHKSRMTCIKTGNSVQTCKADSTSKQEFIKTLLNSEQRKHKNH